MGHATCARVSIGHFRYLISAARIEKMQDRERGFALCVHAAEAVPESAAGHGGDVESSGLDLAMELVQTVDGQLGKRIGIDFRAAIGSGPDAIGIWAP